jgi:hypothetical protein
MRLAILLVLALMEVSRTAHADIGHTRPDAPGGEPCPDWCGHEHAWETAQSGTGPETSPAAIIGLGAASAQIAARTETAAVFGFELRFPLAFRDTASSEQRVIRLRVDLQRLGWRVDAADVATRGADTMRAPTADTGGKVALGYTETLLWFTRWSKLAATIDAEGTRGLDVRGGLGLRTLDTSTRAVGAAGLAVGIHTRAGGIRGHARVLQALTSDPGWTSAIEVGAGIATRFDWPRFHGPWPIEVWADLRERRATDGAARERELATGINYVPKKGFSRIGIVAVTSREQLADGTTGTARTLVFQLDRPFGSL